MRDENLLSWNIPNFISIALMLAIIWCILGFLGHVFVRAPSRKKAGNAASANKIAPNASAAIKQAEQPADFPSYETAGAW